MSRYSFDPIDGALCGICGDVALFRSAGPNPGWRCTTCKRDLTVQEIARSAALVINGETVQPTPNLLPPHA
jgi:hypothetical protein